MTDELTTTHEVVPLEHLLVVSAIGRRVATERIRKDKGWIKERSAQPSTSEHITTDLQAGFHAV